MSGAILLYASWNGIKCVTYFTSKPDRKQALMIRCMYRKVEPIW